MMIGQQKIEAVPQRSRFANSACQPQPMLRSQFSDPGGGHGKKLLYQQKKQQQRVLSVLLELEA